MWHCGSHEGDRASAWDMALAAWGVDADSRHDKLGMVFGRDCVTATVIITAVIGTASSPDLKRAESWVQRHLARHPRFAAVLEGERWVPCDVDVKKHVLLQKVPSEPARGGDPHGPSPAVLAAVQAIISEPLPEGLPMWRVHVLAPEGGKGAGAFVLQASHGIADGISLVALLMACCDDGPPELPGSRSGHGGGGWGGEGMLGALRRGLVALFNTLGSLLWLLSLYLVADSLSPLKTLRDRPHRPKAWGVSRPMTLKRFKAVGVATGCTVNDAVMAVVTLGLGKHVEAAEGRGGASPPRLVRAMVPVNLRPLSEVIDDVRRDMEGRVGRGGGSTSLFGNKWGSVFIRLPFGAPPLEALARLHRRMEAEKRSVGPAAIYQINRALGGGLGARALAKAFRYTSQQLSLVLSNVPGPVGPVRVAGSEVTFLANIVTGSPNVVQLNVLSYNGEVRIASTVAAGELGGGGIDELLGRFEEALEELEGAAAAARGRT